MTIIQFNCGIVCALQHLKLSFIKNLVIMNWWPLVLSNHLAVGEWLVGIVVYVWNPYPFIPYTDSYPFVPCTDTTVMMWPFRTFSVGDMI